MNESDTYLNGDFIAFSAQIKLCDNHNQIEPTNNFRFMASSTELILLPLKWLLLRIEHSNHCC